MIVMNYFLIIVLYVVSFVGFFYVVKTLCDIRKKMKALSEELDELKNWREYYDGMPKKKRKKFLSLADIDLERPSKNGDNYIEYTDISQLWHSTIETPQIKEYDDYVRILVKGDEIISMTTFTKNMDWDTFCWDWTIYQWAYLDDFLPKE